MRARDVEYALQRLLPDGWRVERFALTLTDDFEALVRHVLDAIDSALKLGRYATTPVVPPEPEWSPYK